MDVMDLNIFDIIEAAYRSRLLFRTEEEYREITGVAYETIRDCKEDSDALAEKLRHLMTRIEETGNLENQYEMLPYDWTVAIQNYERLLSAYSKKQEG